MIKWWCLKDHSMYYGCSTSILRRASQTTKWVSTCRESILAESRYISGINLIVIPYSSMNKTMFIYRLIPAFDKNSGFEVPLFYYSANKSHSPLLPFFQFCSLWTYCKYTYFYYCFIFTIFVNETNSLN